MLSSFSHSRKKTTYLFGVLATIVQDEQNLDLFTLTC